MSINIVAYFIAFIYKIPAVSQKYEGRRISYIYGDIKNIEY